MHGNGIGHGLATTLDFLSEEVKGFLVIMFIASDTKQQSFSAIPGLFPLDVTFSWSSLLATSLLPLPGFEVTDSIGHHGQHANPGGHRVDEGAHRRYDGPRYHRLQRRMLWCFRHYSGAAHLVAPPDAPSSRRQRLHGHQLSG